MNPSTELRAGAPLFELRGVDKRFGPTHVLKNISLSVQPREIVGLAGDNGAGKSTLIKVLSGFHRVDGGEIWFDGRKVDLRSPKDARALGIQTVYQDLALIEDLSIARNFFLGAEPVKKLGPLCLLDMEKMRSESERMLKDIGIRFHDVDEDVAFLSGGERQAISIGRSVYFGGKLLILDEPTSALSVKETDRVFGYIREAQARGLAIILITHNLHHMFEVCERFYVLRLGEVIKDMKKADTSVAQLTDLVSGRAH